MKIHRKHITVPTHWAGIHPITEFVTAEVQRSGIRDGLVSVYCLHTSCSLVITENVDPAARRDLEGWFNRLVPEGDPHFVHTIEGPDDMPSHIKTVLTHTSETIPLQDGALLLGTWQGIYLWEHRRKPHHRSLIITVMGV
ncbi:YjbQ family protein [Opitutaceae bacterium TAV4]|nr:YjbQ family protein [Opitutaceae bacterium TAV4]RRJ98781.1 YjbQ family protein [Opitutaceae bacterium TAV3]